jgi:hypothetical protein
MALVAVFIACMAADIVLADAMPLLADEVMRADAVDIFAAADETVLVAGALAGMALAILRVPVPAAVLRVPVPAAVLRVPVPAAVLRVSIPATALLPALIFGLLAAVMDTLLPVRRTRAISAEPRRVAM